MNIIKAIGVLALAVSIIGVTMTDRVMTYNERVFGITDKTWVTNGNFDPSTDQIFYRGAPAATKWYSSKQLSEWGLYGWYKKPKN